MGGSSLLLAVVTTVWACMTVGLAAGQSEPAHAHPTPYGPDADAARLHQFTPRPQDQGAPRPPLSPRPPQRPQQFSRPQGEAVGARQEFFVEGGRRRVEDTQVQCLKTHMLVTFRFSEPFSGNIYPHNKFSECMLYHGKNTREATLQLKHGTCGDQEHVILFEGKSYLDPVIEHRLMIQWEQDFVCDDDSSVIVRCDRPDDFNKTVEWRVETQQLVAGLQRSQHPGPKMWMEIQRGEGPTAPPLATTDLVYIGDVLTLMFTLTDDVYWFDSNILACYAVDGGERKQIEWEESETNQLSPRTHRRYSGEMTVIEQGCSIKPKLFSHFLKERHTRANGNLVTLHYAHFKAFRFPTSMKIIIQCNVQVCYKQCPAYSPCSEAFHPRSTPESLRRRRREAEAAAGEGAHEVDKVHMVRSVEVFLPEEGGHAEVPLASEVLPLVECVDPPVFYAVTLSLAFVSLLLLALLFVVCWSNRMRNHSLFSHTKPQK